MSLENARAACKLYVFKRPYKIYLFSRKKKDGANFSPRCELPQAVFQRYEDDKGGTLAEESKGSSGLDHPNNECLE